MIRWVFFSRFDPIRSTVDRSRAFTRTKKKNPFPSRRPRRTHETNPPRSSGCRPSPARGSAVDNHHRLARLVRSFVRSNCSNNEKRARSRTHGKSASPDPSFVRTRPIDRSTALGRAPARAWDRPPPPPYPVPDATGRDSKIKTKSSRSAIDRSIDRTHDRCASPTKLHMSDCSYRKNGHVLSFNSSMG